MNYTVTAVIGATLAVLLDCVLLRTVLIRRKAFWTAYAIVLFFQLIVNGLLTGLKIVRYDPGAIIGWRIVYAPVEDLLFGFALVLVTLSIWVRVDSWLSPRERR
ncbi:MAG TPA: lycopene cyclase domain-containing protein [Jatrophihabitans sp.]|jgi:lycopene cyclase domain-containing protein